MATIDTRASAKQTTANSPADFQSPLMRRYKALNIRTIIMEFLFNGTGKNTRKFACCTALSRNLENENMLCKTER